jgi:AraC-like DNA-binding protein
VIVFDAARTPPKDRADAFHRALNDVTVPTVTTYEGPGEAVRCRMQAWQFGAARLVATTGTGLELRRGPRHLRLEGPPAVALSMQTSGLGWFDHLGEKKQLPSGGLKLVDLTAPYRFGWSGVGGNQGLQVGYDTLGLPVDLVRRSIGCLPASPMYSILQHHLRSLSRHGDTLSTDAGAAALGAATTELLRAFIVSAVGDPARARPILADTETVRLVAFLRSRLSDPELCPEQIAAAHNISVRQLYKLCERAGFSLEQWIITARLEGARAELAAPAGRRRKIAAVARGWGFANPSHFTKRFHGAFGVTPREWQQHSRNEQRAGRSGPAASS